jgi:peptidoglycan-associated lipoprotein
MESRTESNSATARLRLCRLSSLISLAPAAVGLVTLQSALGCSHQTTTPMPATVFTTTTTTTSAAAPSSAVGASSPGKPSSTIYLSDRLRAACGITEIASVAEAPKFDFDQDVILSEDRDVLAQVAQCLTTGPLKGRRVKLVGRADPRGTPEYNLALGEHRSFAVLSYLTGLGVPTAQMTETSRGSLDATGNDEATWRQDRRVDIDVFDTTP